MCFVNIWDHTNIPTCTYPARIHMKAHLCYEDCGDINYAYAQETFKNPDGTPRQKLSASEGDDLMTKIKEVCKPWAIKHYGGGHSCARCGAKLTWPDDYDPAGVKPDME